MSLVKTPIYLTLEQRETLKGEAKDQHVSLSERIRQILDERIQYLGTRVKKRKIASFIGIGKSGLTDVSVNHDKYLGEAIAKEHNIR